MTEKKEVTPELPGDPEANARYQHLNQLNPQWWQIARNLAEDTRTIITIDGIVKSAENTLEIPWFNRIVSIHPPTRIMTYLGDRQPRLHYQEGLVILALLNYLARQKKLPRDTGLVNENHLTGGTTFFRGPHLMASVIIAQKFGDKGTEFIKKAQTWGGRPAPYGEFGIKFEIFPGLSWIIALWEGDNEFPARAQYLFDRKLEQMFQLDIVWAIGNLIAAKFS